MKVTIAASTSSASGAKSAVRRPLIIGASISTRELLTLAGKPDVAMQTNKANPSAARTTRTN